jgi:hypothetical protein
MGKEPKRLSRSDGLSKIKRNVLCAGEGNLVLRGHLSTMETATAVNGDRP